MKRSNLVITILLFILAALCFIFFEAIPTTIVSDPIANHLLCGFIARLGLGLLFGWTLYLFAGKSMFTFNKTFAVNLAWSLPCFMVALVNFPYSAIISKEVTIDYANLLGLYILFVVSIALLEEFIFRGIVLLVVKDYLNGKKHAPLKIVVICSAIFSLFHLTNLLTPNPDVGGVLLQCVYTFLIGAMLTVTMLKLKNIWLCIVIHAIFDFGGLLTIHQIGSGNPWDTLFWILTIVSGVLCAGHIIYTLIKLEKDYAS